MVIYCEGWAFVKIVITDDLQGQISQWLKKKSPASCIWLSYSCVCCFLDLRSLLKSLLLIFLLEYVSDTACKMLRFIKKNLKKEQTNE